MQQDRLDGNITYQEPDERTAYLASLGVANVAPPLPPSPCVKHIITGEIHQWSEAFAARPDILQNCDEQGNTDPAAWQNKQPVTKAAEPAIKAVRKKPIAAPEVPGAENLMFSIDEFVSGPFPGANPMVATAPTMLGVPVEIAKDYTDPGSTRAALPLVARGGHGNQTIEDVVQHTFKRQTS